LSPKITADLRNRLGLSVPHFQVIVTKLRKAGIIVGGDIYPDYRLNLPISKDIFNLTLSINFITK
jgi:DNA-binding Lrp family transcriptional regulator